jgi:tRNA 2-thiocytidine biosynthesis protein TtcA
MSEKLPYQALLEGDLPLWVMRFVKATGRAINRYSMIRDGDTILLSASGGKDSLALALALSLRKKWLPIDYALKAVMINWKEHPIPEEYREKLAVFFTDLGYTFHIFDEEQYPSSFGGEFNCYLCSRNRRRILFDRADREGIVKIAMGHHLDDLVETSLMNLCFRGTFETMKPVQPFFNGKIQVIRPMIEIHERQIRRLSERYDLPVIKPVCPHDRTNIRSQLKPIVKSLVRIDPLTREHIYKAHHFEESV